MYIIVILHPLVYWVYMVGAWYRWDIFDEGVVFVNLSVIDISRIYKLYSVTVTIVA